MKNLTIYSPIDSAIVTEFMKRDYALTDETSLEVYNNYFNIDHSPRMDNELNFININSINRLGINKFINHLEHSYGLTDRRLNNVIILENEFITIRVFLSEVIHSVMHISRYNLIHPCDLFVKKFHYFQEVSDTNLSDLLTTNYMDNEVSQLINLLKIIAKYGQITRDYLTYMLRNKYSYASREMKLFQEIVNEFNKYNTI